MNTLNLQASKAIQALGVEVESEEWWNEHDSPAGGSLWQLDGVRPHPLQVGYPAPNLQELLLALPEIGEKLGWDVYTKVFVSGAGFSRSGKTEEYHAHHLLDIFLEKGMEGVSEEIIGLVENK